MIPRRIPDDPTEHLVPRMKLRLHRRAFGAALVAGIASAACRAGASTATPTSLIGPKVLPTVTASPVTGHLLLVHGGNAYDFDLSTLRETQITHFGQNVFLTTPTLSPDRQRMAYTFYAIPSDPKDLGGSDLYVGNADLSSPRLLRAHPHPGASFEEPAWAADGQSILATVREPSASGGPDVITIDRVGLKDGEMSSVVANAQSPTTSPDGKHLAYLTRDNSGQPNHLWISNPDGTAPRELAADAKFSLLRAPRFAPDSGRLAFAAVGGPPTKPASSSRAAFARAQGLPWNLTGVAEAHGIPWEIWTIGVDGADPRRLTDEQEDSPTPAWSPNGEWIAFAGEIATYLVDAAGQRTLCLTTIVSAGGIVWLK